MSTNDEYVESLKQMLASSVTLGIRLSESGYQGQIRSDAKRPVLDAMTELNHSVAQFLSQNGPAGIDASAVLPLHAKASQ